MRRQMNEYELAEFYHRIGAAIWHVQSLEDILANFLTLKTVHEHRCSGQKVNMQNAVELLTDKRKITLGPLIESCVRHKIIAPELRKRFESFKNQRHWLVHRSMVENGDDLYVEETRNAVFARIAAVKGEARALGALIFQECERWIASHGVDLDVVNSEAEEAVRKLKGVPSSVGQEG